MKFTTLRALLSKKLSQNDSVADQVAEQGRRRILRVGATGATTILARGVAVLAGLLTLPLTSHYLGKERFGVWLTLSSVITWMAVADLGLTNSLVNALSTADGKQDRRAAQQAVASTFWLVAAITAVLILCCLIFVPFVAWAKVFNITSPQAVSEINAAVLVVLVLCLLRLPTTITGSIYQAYQEGYYFQFWNGVSGLLTATGLLIAIRWQAGIAWLAAAFLGGMLLADLLAAIHLFVWRRRWLLPDPRSFHWAQATWLVRRGVQFWVAQMSAVLMLQMNLFLATRLFGASESAGYGTALRLFTLIGAIQMAFVAPLWAAYGEAATRHDHEWLTRTFKHSIQVSLLWTVTASLGLVLAMPWLLKILVTADVTVSWHLRLAILASEVAYSMTRCIATFLNGLGAIRSQAIFGPIGGLTNVTLGWLLGRWIGVPGVSWATAICLLIFWVGVMGSDAAIRLREQQKVTP